MEFSIAKRQMTEGTKVPNKGKTKTREKKETYKYLRILETDTVKEAVMREKI